MFAGAKDPLEEVVVSSRSDLKGVAAVFQASSSEGVVAVLEGAGVEGLALIVGQMPRHTFPSIAFSVHHLKGEAMVEAKDARRGQVHAHRGIVVASVHVGAAQIQDVVLHHAAFVGLLAQVVPRQQLAEEVVGDDLRDTRLGCCEGVTFGCLGDQQGRGRPKHVGQMPLGLGPGLGGKRGCKGHQKPGSETEVRSHDGFGWSKKDTARAPLCECQGTKKPPDWGGFLV